MKKIIISLILVLSITNKAFADTEAEITSNLMGLGVAGAVASYIADEITSGATSDASYVIQVDNDFIVETLAGTDALVVDTATGAVTVYGSIQGSGANRTFSSNDGTRNVTYGITGSQAVIGTTTAHQLDILTAGSARWSVDSSGNLFQDTTNGGLLIFNKANTTMRFNGAMGNSTKAPQTVAPDDWIEVNIAGTTYYIPVYAAS